MRNVFLSGILVFALTLVWAAPAHAELGRTLYGKRGTWTMGGAAAFDVNFDKQYEPSKATTWDNAYRVDLFPEVGYVFVKGFEATFGPRLTYAADADKNTTTLYGGTLSAWYHYQLMGTLFLSSGLRFSMAMEKEKKSNVESDILDWLVGPRIGLTMSFGGKFGGFLRLAVRYDFGGEGITTGTTSTKKWQMDLGLVSSLGIFF